MLELPVFRPNNHSNWRILYKPVSDITLRDKIKDIVLKFYKSIAENITSVEQVCETEINSNNFSVTYTDKRGVLKKILVRTWPLNRTQNSIENTLTAADFLKNQMCLVPISIAADSGSKFVQVGGQFAAIFKFINGNHFRGTFSEIKSIASALGKLDNALDKLPDNNQWRHLTSQQEADLFSFSVDEWKDLLIRNNGDDSDFGQTLHTYRALVMSKVELIGEFNFKNFQRRIAHCDLHPHNFITDNDRLVSFLDLDSLQEMEHFRALAFGLHRLVRQYIVFQGFNTAEIPRLIQEAKEMFIEEYQKNHTLPSKEISQLRNMIIHEILHRITYVVKNYYLHENTVWAGELKKQLAFLIEADFF